MVDINKWYMCKLIKPKKKGKYDLLVGKKSTVGAWLESSIIISVWNGHVWDIPEGFVPMQWKFLKLISKNTI